MAEDSATLRKELLTRPAFRHSEPKKKHTFSATSFLPFGCALTVVALARGLWDFNQARTLWAQRMMRLRVFAQGLTIAALVFTGIDEAGPAMEAKARSLINSIMSTLKNEKEEEKKENVLYKHVAKMIGR